MSVQKIRPEDGLGRKRDRDGHRELQRSIQQFGVLTPITVRIAPGTSDEFLLVKGQGRTLACRLLGISMIPAIIVPEGYGDSEKVQQFLVENVARLKMRPVDRALLIGRARQQGEESAAIATRFGVSASTVRRLLAQLDGATTHEVDALRQGDVSLAVHAVLARHVEPCERPAVLDVVAGLNLRSKDLECLFVAIGWSHLVELGGDQFRERMALLRWACVTLSQSTSGTLTERLGYLAHQFPMTFEHRQRGRTEVMS